MEKKKKSTLNSASHTLQHKTHYLEHTSHGSRGITLIALVVTIIILLILAGVSITMLTGNNGILGQTENAKELTEMARLKEQAELIKQDMLIEAKINGTTIGRGNLVKRITEELDGVREGYTSIVENGKYVIKVDEQLNIEVEKYTGEYLEEGELGLVLTPVSTAQRSRRSKHKG